MVLHIKFAELFWLWLCFCLFVSLFVFTSDPQCIPQHGFKDRKGTVSVYLTLPMSFGGCGRVLSSCTPLFAWTSLVSSPASLLTLPEPTLHEPGLPALEH